MSPLPDGLARLNALAPDGARAALLRCCGSEVWVERMLEARPFRGEAEFFDMSEEIWWELSQEDWLEAFGRHPRIGDVDSLRGKFKETTEWAGGEQAGVAGADEETLRRLAEGNRNYEQKFDYIFIVCASGKTAPEMLAMLESRLPNEPRNELKIAATEQARITRLRIEKLLEGDA